MKRIGLGIALVLMLSQSAWAAKTPMHEAAESPEYGRKAGGMIGRGLINVATCFVDLLVNVVNETRNGPPVVGTLVGVGKGAGCTTLRALSGGADLLTFWVPGFNGMPVSDSYDDCLAVSAGGAGTMTPSGASMPAGYPEMEPSHGATSPSARESGTPREEKPRYTK